MSVKQPVSIQFNLKSDSKLALLETLCQSFWESRVPGICNVDRRRACSAHRQTEPVCRKDRCHRGKCLSRHPDRRWQSAWRPFSARRKPQVVWCGASWAWYRDDPGHHEGWSDLQKLAVDNVCLLHIDTFRRCLQIGNLGYTRSARKEPNLIENAISRTKGIKWILSSKH